MTFDWSKSPSEIVAKNTTEKMRLTMVLPIKLNSFEGRLDLADGTSFKP